MMIQNGYFKQASYLCEWIVCVLRKQLLPQTMIPLKQCKCDKYRLKDFSKIEKK